MQPNIYHFLQGEVVPRFVDQIVIEHLSPTWLHVTANSGRFATVLTLRYADAPHGCGFPAQYYWVFVGNQDLPKAPVDPQSPWINVACQDREDLEAAILNFLVKTVPGDGLVEVRVVVGKGGAKERSERILVGDSDTGVLTELPERSPTPRSEYVRFPK